MAKPDAPDEHQKSVTEDVAEKVFSSEKREDVWALLIALGIFLLSIAFPAQVHDFFASLLILF